VTSNDLKEKGRGLDEACHSCLAIPGRIIEICAHDCHSAVVDALGMRRKIDVTLIGDDKPGPGDWVLVHVGFAMSKISEQDASDRLRTLNLLGQTGDAAQEVCGYQVPDRDAATSSQ
jgi:hydrogenase expression/formation protein HypC